MKTYLGLIEKILSEGIQKDDRTGTGTLSVFGPQIEFDLTKGFPMVTTKKCHLRSIIHELLWFLKGDTNIAYLKENKVRIWDEWADENGELGPVYGKQWRSWETTDGQSIDQIAQLEKGIKENPTSRRHLVIAYNPGEVHKMALPPCHCFFQFFVDPHAQTLSCKLYQRSADVFLGVPFNIASYSLFTMMLAQACNLKPHKFIHTFGDTHLYLNHLEQAKTQLLRTPRPLPQMKINPNKKSIFDFEYSDFELLNYDPHPAISAPVSI